MYRCFTGSSGPEEIFSFYLEITPVPCLMHHRFNRCWRNFFTSTWHALWVIAWWLHRGSHLTSPVHPVILAFLHMAWALHGPLHQWYGTGVSAANRLDRCIVTGASGATVSVELVQFAFLWVLSSCFALLGLFASSLRSINIHLTNSLVPLIALLFNPQNHKTMA